MEKVEVTYHVLFRNRIGEWTNVADFETCAQAMAAAHDMLEVAKPGSLDNRLQVVELTVETTTRCKFRVHDTKRIDDEGHISPDGLPITLTTSN